MNAPATFPPSVAMVAAMIRSIARQHATDDGHGWPGARQAQAAEELGFRVLAELLDGAARDAVEALHTAHVARTRLARTISTAAVSDLEDAGLRLIEAGEAMLEEARNVEVM